MSYPPPALLAQLRDETRLRSEGLETIRPWLNKMTELQQEALADGDVGTYAALTEARERRIRRVVKG